MADIYSILKIFRPRRTILSEDFNNTETAIKAAFDSLGQAATAGRSGVSTPFAVGDATHTYHAISKSQFDAATGGFTGSFVVDADVTVTAGVSTNLHMMGLSANRTVNLPQNPTEGQLVRIYDSEHIAATHTILVNRDTRSIGGLAADLSIQVAGAVVTLVYDATETNWAIASVVSTPDAS